MSSAKAFSFPLAVCFACALSIGAAGAQDAKVATLADLDATQAHTLMLKAQVLEAEQAAKLKQSSPGSTVTTAQGAVVQATSSSDERDVGVPTVTDTYGGRNGLTASFLYGNGGTASGRKGDPLPGGYRIQSITVASTTLKKGDRTYVLANSVTPINNQPAQSSMSMQPGGLQAGGMIAPLPFPAPSMAAPLSPSN